MSATLGKLRGAFPMQAVLVGSVVASVLACSVASAARLEFEALFSSTVVYSVYLRGESTSFNGVGFSIKPDHGSQFLDVTSGLVAGVPRPPGDPFTYRNRM